ncbi:hypothetical protein EQG64_24740 [Streptomyces sp. S6]|nr:hypothetical protein EQG64_24740 [Streptomyces sp. S6]
MLRSLSCNVMRASAAAVAVGLMALGAPAVAQAAEADPVLRFFHGSSDKVNVVPYESQSDNHIRVHVTNEGSRVLTGFTVTLDARAFKGQMSLTVSEACVEKTSLVFVCDGEKLNGGKPLRPKGSFFVEDATLRPLATAQFGFTGDVKLSAEAADGVLLGETTLKATVADLGPVSYHREPVDVGAKPGGTLRPSVGFMQYSGQPLQGVYVSMYHSRGLAFAEEFSNCEYGDWGEALVAAECYVETPVEPGASYDLDGLAWKVGATALAERWSVSFYAKRVGEPRDMTNVHRGTGR